MFKLQRKSCCTGFKLYSLLFWNIPRMNSLTAAQQRYTCKAFDATQKLSDQQLHTLLEVLRLSPSSVNSQPWQFLVAASPEAKARIAKTMPGHYSYNAVKVMDASHSIVLCSRTALDDGYLAEILAQDVACGRFANEEAKQATATTRKGYVDMYREQGVIAAWAQKQTYLALGQLLLAAGFEGIDATPMEGFDVDLLNTELGLKQQGLHAVVVVALGFHSDKDFNADLPKSRLTEQHVVQFL